MINPAIDVANCEIESDDGVAGTTGTAGATGATGATGTPEAGGVAPLIIDVCSVINCLIASVSSEIEFFKLDDDDDDEPLSFSSSS